MGVPAFFRWISNKYPHIILNCFEAKKIGTEELDWTLPNPNGFEIDNLYLDMNGIIHPCTHPENQMAPPTLQEMFKTITDYIDRILTIVRPRRLLYMAIDGVAPRAKMNQQRSRRFRSSRDKIVQEKALNDMRDIVMSKGFKVPEKRNIFDFDSNCITPGTVFMRKLKDYLVAYISNSLANRTEWQDLLVILSDSSVPGEGEHKIMDYIRRQRAKPGYDPNMVHCMYGADADLIMLGLATHEPNFIIIREEFTPPGLNKSCPVCYKSGHSGSECNGINFDHDLNDEESELKGSGPEFLFIKLPVLRECLYRDFYNSNELWELDFERMIDDWILICFLVGNDFLPHLPSLEIREGAIDRIWSIYQNRVLKLSGNYLCHNGKLNIENFKNILFDLGLLEDQIFKQRVQRQKIYEENKKYYKNLEKLEHDKYVSTEKSNQKSNSSIIKAVKRHSSEVFEKPDDSFERAELILDEIRLGEEGWKIRYYTSKFHIKSSEIDSYRKRLANEYLIGVSWVLQYYYQGCASWKWSYPFHYSPFASDFILVNSEDVNWTHEFDPFKPYEQLMGVLPESSKDLIPKCYHVLMQSFKSEIVDFYPKEFNVDINGKRQEWQGVALIPFIDESRLRNAMIPHTKKLTEEEISLNTFGENLIFMRDTNILGEIIIKESSKLDCGKYFSLEDIKYNLIFGDIKVIDCVNNSVPHSKSLNLDNIPINEHILCLYYRDFIYEKGFIFKAVLLDNAEIPNPILKSKNQSFNKKRYPTNFNEKSNRPVHVTDEAKRMIQRSFYPEYRTVNSQQIRKPHRNYNEFKKDHIYQNRSEFVPRFNTEYRRDFGYDQRHSQNFQNQRREDYSTHQSYQNPINGRRNIYNRGRYRFPPFQEHKSYNDRYNRYQ